jgi:hypothetical protein
MIERQDEFTDDTIPYLKVIEFMDECHIVGDLCRIYTGGDKPKREDLINGCFVESWRVGNKMREYLRSCPTQTPSRKDLIEFARFTQKFWKEGIEIMRANNLKIESDTPMEKLAFTFYTNLCEIDSEASHLFQESYGEDNYKDERLPDGVTYSPEHDATIISKARERVQPLIDAAQEFVDRCDRGEVQSKYTYSKFKKLLESLRERDSK